MICRSKLRCVGQSCRTEIVVQLCSCACQMPAHGVCCQLRAFLHAARGLGRPSQPGVTKRTIPALSCRCLVDGGGFHSGPVCCFDLGSSLMPLALFQWSYLRECSIVLSAPHRHILLIHRFETIRFPLFKASTVFFSLRVQYKNVL